ncbi:unnamed protein product [Amoebophrya sp. A25]|nr:unnamed protein product [Amoebophrya sp. A25]|eukprot:GSA25T00008004001.1
MKNTNMKRPATKKASNSKSSSFSSSSSVMPSNPAAPPVVVESAFAYKQRLETMSNFMLRTLLEALQMVPGRTRRAMIAQLMTVRTSQSAAAKNAAPDRRQEEEVGETRSAVDGDEHHDGDHYTTEDVGADRNVDRPVVVRAHNHYTSRHQAASASASSSSKTRTTKRTASPVDVDLSRRAQAFLQNCDCYHPPEHILLFQELRFYHARASPSGRPSFLLPQDFLYNQKHKDHEAVEEEHFLQILCCRVTSASAGGQRSKGGGTSTTSGGQEQGKNVEQEISLAWPKNKVEVTVSVSTRTPSSSSSSNAKNDFSTTSFEINPGTTANPLCLRDAVIGLAEGEDQLEVEGGSKTRVSVSVSVNEPFFDDNANYFVLVSYGRFRTVAELMERFCEQASDPRGSSSPSSRFCEQASDPRGSSPVVHPESSAGEILGTRRARSESTDSVVEILPASPAPPPLRNKGSTTRTKRKSTTTPKILLPSSANKKRRRGSSQSSVIAIEDDGNDSPEDHTSARAPGTSRGNNICPLSLDQIEIPAKGTKCRHDQAFDLRTFLEYHSNPKRSRRFHCPICGQFLLCSTQTTTVERMILGTSGALGATFNMLRVVVEEQAKNKPS